MKISRWRGVACAAGFALALTTAGLVGTAGQSTAAETGCGQTIYKSDGTPWQCSFNDHFAGTTLDRTKWVPFTTKNTGYVSKECRVDSPNNISVQEGTLHLTIRQEPAPFLCEMPTGGFMTQYTGGGVTTWNKFTPTYGRFETRAAFPSTTKPGLHGAIWMWPQSNKARYGADSGEIDTAEFRTGQPDVMAPYLHFKPDLTWKNETGITNLDGVTEHCKITNPGHFHTYAVEWTRNNVDFIYDGKLCLSVANWKPQSPLAAPQPMDEPFFLIMNIAFGDAQHNPFVPGVTQLPGTMKIDYVKAWS